jgi:hypothetical protein
MIYGEQIAWGLCSKCGCCLRGGKDYKKIFVKGWKLIGGLCWWFFPSSWKWCFIFIFILFLEKMGFAV